MHTLRPESDQGCVGGALSAASPELISWAPMSKARPAELSSASVPGSQDDAQDEGYVVVSHESLFDSSSPVERCDACGSVLPPPTDEDDAGYSVRGMGVYHWVRGTEARFEKVPLCPSCAAAIGMTALARWEIEEEEG
jgi:hypothetical protein